MKGISMSSVLQVINLERQSCDIHAQADGRVGQLHFRNGELVDASADDLVGEAAAYAILAWHDPEFEVATDDSPRNRNIETDLTHLLLETARRQDEENANMSGSGNDGNGNGNHSATEVDTPSAVATPAPAPAAASAPAGPAPRAPGTLNAAGLKRVVELAQEGLGDALLSADVYSSADGTSYVGVNSMPTACALFNQVTERMSRSLDKSNLPTLGRYYMAELSGSKMMLVAPCGTCQLNLIVDSSRVQLGLLLNVILPEVLSALEEASGR